jgi:hypothetical protein
MQGARCAQPVLILQLLLFAKKIPATIFPRLIFNALRLHPLLFAFLSPVEVVKHNGTTPMGDLYVLLLPVQLRAQILGKALPPLVLLL